MMFRLLSAFILNPHCPIPPMLDYTSTLSDHLAGLRSISMDRVDRWDHPARLKRMDVLLYGTCSVRPTQVLPGSIILDSCDCDLTQTVQSVCVQRISAVLDKSKSPRCAILM